MVEEVERCITLYFYLSLVNASIIVKAKSKKHFWVENTFQNVKFYAMLQVGINEV